MSDETAVAETEDAEVAVEVDEQREAQLEAISGEVGDAVVEHHLKPGDDLWIRVDRDNWVETAATLRGDWLRTGALALGLSSCTSSCALDTSCSFS